MKRAKREDGSNSIGKMLLELPQGILQRILYFLPQEDAVRTSVLSRSWRNIWFTRSNLHFSETSFRGGKQEFISTVDKTLQRYCDRRLALEEFHLCLWIGGSDHEPVALLEKWIPRFATVGVKEFHLSIISNHYVDVSSLVFKPQSLKILCLKHCKLGQENILDQKRPFLRLQVLRLRHVLIKKETFHEIISSCPLLTTVFFEECKSLKNIKLETKLHRYLKNFTFINADTYMRDECSIEIDIPTIETIEIVGSKIRFHGHEFSNLKSLILKWVEISANSFDNSSCYRFPNLRFLNIFYCYGFEKYQLRIDAPNISYFQCVGQLIPSISFAPTSSEWTSDIKLSIDKLDDAPSWLLKLSELLHGLSQSEISLSIDQSRWMIEQDILVQDSSINGGNKPVVVEHLQLSCNMSSSVPSFLNGLFCTCRPRNIARLQFSTKLGYCHKETEQKQFVELLCETLMKRSLEIERFKRTATFAGGARFLECALLAKH